MMPTGPARRRRTMPAGAGAAAVALSLVLAAASSPARAASLAVEQLELANGMTFLVVARPTAAMTAAAWAVRAGSADEEPGETGLAHLLEHVMFHGTRVIGTHDADRELPLLAREEALRLELRELEEKKGASERQRRQLARELERLLEEQRALAKKGEYALLYTQAGAVGIDALTSEDLTLYSMQLPTNKLELWFWMESDRLLHPVFRELYQELDVIDEERRQRIESIPGASERARFAEQFWPSPHPYSWPSIGRREDLGNLTRQRARAFFATHYRPQNLIAAIVGNVDIAEIRTLAERYFGRLEPRPPDHLASAASPEAKSTHPPPPRSDLRMQEMCDCPTQVEIRYRTVPFGHPDSYPLDALAGLLGGRSGRLHRQLVLERGIAFSAEVLHNPRRRDGDLTLRLVARSDATPAELEAAWEQELELLTTEPVPDHELDRVKNRATADAYRRIEAPLEMALRLLVYAALGDWRHLEEWPQRLEAVGKNDLKRVARSYLISERRGVLRLERRTGGSG